MGNNRQIKEAKVSEIKEKMEKAQGIVFTKYQGLTVEEDTELRKNLRNAGIEYKVYKNTLTILAAKELGFDAATSMLEGPLSVAFGYEDPATAAKVINDFAKTHKKMELVGGIVQGEIFDEVKIKQLATIPSREVLISKLLGSFKAPLSNLAYMLNAVKEKKETEV